MQCLIDGNGTDWFIVKRSTGWHMYDTEQSLLEANIQDRDYSARIWPNEAFYDRRSKGTR